MAEDPKKILHTLLERAVVKVLVGDTFKGTGFFITPDYLLTAYHCIGGYVDENNLFAKSTVYGKLRVFFDREKSFRDDKIDIAVLKLFNPIEITDYLPLGLLNEGHITDDILAVGYPAEIFCLVDGKIRGFPEQYPRMFFNNAMVAEGQSGGVVYHFATQRVVGLALSIYKQEVMKYGGLAGRFDILLRQWPELQALNQRAIARWERRLKKEEKPRFEMKKILPFILVGIVSIGATMFVATLFFSPSKAPVPPVSSIDKNKESARPDYSKATVKINQSAIGNTADVDSFDKLHPVIAAKPDKTSEDIQKKAVVIKYPSVKLFKQATGDTGEEVSFMQLYFIMKPEMNGRIPVSKSPNKTGEPDGWLAKDSFIEWNTVQMIQLEPQSGRKLAKVFDTLECANSFAMDGQVATGCQELGSEPSAWGDKKFENQKLLIPVFAKEKYAFQGGFIRVFETGKSVKAVPEYTFPIKEQKTLGYDVVFAIDSTANMSQYFNPTAEAVQEFVKEKISEFTASEGGQKIKTPLRMGVLFYRDRPDSEASKDPSCEGSYVNQWRQELTEQIDSIVNALKNEKEGCGGDEPEAILDALNRVIIDTQWQDNSFRAIILVGDAPAHGIDKVEKNPMKLDVATINKQAEEKSIRFLNIKIGEDDLKTFKTLALATSPQNRGRYVLVPKGDIGTFKQTLLDTLNKEWALLASTVKITADIQTDKTKIPTPSDGLTSYEALIIEGILPPSADPSQALPTFMKGWIPEKIQGRLVASEFIFMDKSKLKMMTNTLDNIAEAALVGDKEGADAFILTVQNALASQLSMQPSEIFKSGETLDGILKKANILPFKTTVLVFSAQEIQSWKTPDYQRLNAILSEKVKYLRELSQNATAVHMFGDKPHLYVPRAFFP
ncbi:MAG: hypothetical protein BWK78_05870 [Thiotrichaceae bacterium IS1]|nr:MAG: hypothetical protein BWK78_05870 [Thiotrichaceae bacterium IS1]